MSAKDRSDCALWLIDDVLNEEQLDATLPPEVHEADLVGWILTAVISRTDQPPEVYLVGEKVFEHLRDNVLTGSQLDMVYGSTGKKLREL